MQIGPVCDEEVVRRRSQAVRAVMGGSAPCLIGAFRRLRCVGVIAQYDCAIVPIEATLCM